MNTSQEECPVYAKNPLKLLHTSIVSIQIQKERGEGRGVGGGEGGQQREEREQEAQQGQEEVNCTCGNLVVSLLSKSQPNK